MAHESNPFEHNKNIAHKLPHPGDIPVEEGGERPVREFDNTPLDEAHRQGLIGEAPDTVAEGFEAVPHTPEEIQEFKEWQRQKEQPTQPESHKKRNILIGGVAVVAAGAVAAGAMFGLGGKDKDDTPRANPTNPVATASPNPGQSHESKPSSPEHSSDKPDVKLTNILDSEYYKTLTPSQQEVIKSLHNMDVETFKEQPAETQHMFSRVERDAYRGYTIKVLNEVLPNGITPGSPTTPPTENASAKQIMDSNMIEGVIPYMMLTRNSDPFKVYNANRADAIKTEIGSVANVDMAGTQSDINNLDSIDALNGNLYYTHVKTANQLGTSTTTDGTKEKVIAVHYSEVDDGLAHIYDQTYTMDYVSYKNIKGNTVGEWMPQNVHRS